MNIAQISKLGTRGAALLSKILELAPFLQFVEFRLDASTHLVIKDADTSTSTAARAEGSAAQRDAQVPSAVARSLALYSREISIDDVRKLDANVGVSPAGLKLFADRRVMGLAAKFAEEIQNHMFVGTDASNMMLGLLELVKDAAFGGQTSKLGLTTAELAAMNTQVSVGQLSTNSVQDAFVELLMKELANVPGANAIIVNSNLGPRLSMIAKRLGASGETVNSFGVKVPAFNNVPIVQVPTSAISSTQSDGSNSDCTSLLIARFAEDLGVCFNTNSGFYFQDFDEVEAKPNGIARLSMYTNLVVERPDALKRLSRIRL
jgi:hypothetical protein